MKYPKKLALLLCSVLLLCGCQSPAAKTEPTQEIEENVEEAQGEENAETVETHIGEAISPLTGLWVDQETVQKRPFAVVINNLHKALPQSGIGQADVMYEVLAEGEITRLVAIFQDPDAEKIGPVRSARDYFTYFALDHDAIFVHHGGSEGAYAAIPRRGVEALDGMTDRAFWRDEARASEPGMYEHSSYTDAEGLVASAQRRGYDLEMTKAPMFSFWMENEKEAGVWLSAKAQEATYVELPYSYDQISQFTYDEQTGLYFRAQSDEPQVDDQTGEQLSFTNVLIQQVETWNTGDALGHRDMNLVGSGSGIYITQGKAVPIRWEKTAYDAPTQWMEEDGTKLLLQPGKTFLCVYPAGQDFFVGTKEEANGNV